MMGSWPCGGRAVSSGPRTLKYFALMIQEVNLVTVEIMAALLVAHKGVVVPAIPQATHNVEKLARAGVPRI